jgi:predicted  nucleic acid-binding Zn-ribbon protein
MGIKDTAKVEEYIRQDISDLKDRQKTLTEQIEQMESQVRQAKVNLTGISDAIEKWQNTLTDDESTE